MRAKHGLLLALLGIAAWPSTASPAVSATCADYPNQKAAQEAADTVDADGDGIYCESLPCPCSGAAEQHRADSCTKPSGVRKLIFSKAKYPGIRLHFRAAVRRGWPRRLVINRPGASARRDRLLAHIATRQGYDRDEYPPAVLRGKGKGLERGRHPRGWKADVRYVPSAENRSHGASLGAQIARWCDGTRVRYVFR
jgi:hypothetical protein